MSESPFRMPGMMWGYPMDPEEEESVARVLRDPAEEGSSHQDAAQPLGPGGGGRVKGRELRFKVMWRQLQEAGHAPYPDDPDGWPPYRRYMHMELGGLGVTIHLADSPDRSPVYAAREDFERLGVLDLDTGDLVDAVAEKGKAGK